MFQNFLRKSRFVQEILGRKYLGRDVVRGK